MEISNFIEWQLLWLLGVFAYVLILKPLRYFQFNRGYLALLPLLSLIPTQISWKNSYEMGSTLLPEVTINNAAVSSLAESAQQEYNAAWIYGIIVALLLLRVLLQLLPPSYTNKVKGSYGWIYINKNIKSPFTFFNRVYAPEADLDPMIEQHERVHLQRLHFVDLLWFNLLSCLLWFNPAAWISLSESKLNHEFEADAKVCKDSDRKTYAELLLQHAFNLPLLNRPLFTSHIFNKQQLKQRIMKMSNNKQNKRSLLHLLWVLPLALGITIACSEKPEKQSETPALTVAEEMPEFPGGKEGLIGFFGENMEYPEEAKKDSLVGTVFVSFIVDTDGQVKDAQVLKSVDPILDQAALAMISKMPKWKPGKNKGELVPVIYNIPIRFQLD